MIISFTGTPSSVLNRCRTDRRTIRADQIDVLVAQIFVI